MKICAGAILGLKTRHYGVILSHWTRKHDKVAAKRVVQMVSYTCQV